MALVILSVAGIALMETVTTALRSEREAQVRESVLATEDRLLVAFTLLKRGELDQRIGHRQVGEFIVDVQRPEPTLYRIAVRQQSSTQLEDLVTVVYRPELR